MTKHLSKCSMYFNNVLALNFPMKWFPDLVLNIFRNIFQNTVCILIKFLSWTFQSNVSPIFFLYIFTIYLCNYFTLFDPRSKLAFLYGTAHLPRFFYWARLNKMDRGASIIELRYANHVQISSRFFIKQISLNDWYVKNIIA